MIFRNSVPFSGTLPGPPLRRAALILPEPRALEDASLASVDLVVGLLELLARPPGTLGLSEIARTLGISKSRAHRNLRALVGRGYAFQDPVTERYGIGVKVLALGESVRERFELRGVVRPVMERLRDDTGQTVTASALVNDAVVVLDLVPGRTLIEFGIRPGATLEMHASAHGLVALAFGPPELLERVLARPRRAWTDATLVDAAALRAEVERTRRRRWAVAPGQLLEGVNALAAPMFDHRGAWCGTLALVGSTQFIRARPSPEQIALVSGAASDASGRLHLSRGAA